MCDVLKRTLILLIGSLLIASQPVVVSAQSATFPQNNTVQWRSVGAPTLAQAEPNTNSENDPFRNFSPAVAPAPVADTTPTAAPPQVTIKPPSEETLASLGERIGLEEDEAKKTKANKTLVEIREHLAALSGYGEKEREIVALTTNLPDEAKRIDEQIKQFAAQPEPVSPNLPLKELEAQLEEAKSQLASAETLLKADKTSLDSNAERLVSAEGLQKSLPDQIRTAEEALKSAPVSGTLSDDLKSALLRSQIARWKAEQTEVKAEIDYLRAVKEKQLVESYIDYHKKLIEREKKRVAVLTPEVERGREKERVAQVKEAKQAIKSVPVPLRGAAEKNRLLTVEAGEVDKKGHDILDDLADVEEKIRHWDEVEKDLETRSETQEESKILGLELRSQLGQLPSIEEIRLRRVARFDVLEDARLREYLIQQEIVDLGDEETAAKKFLEGVTIPTNDDEVSQAAANVLLQAAASVAEKRIETLKSLKKQYTDYQDNGRKVYLRELELTKLLTRVKATITGRMLWTRSHPSMVDFRRESSEWFDGDRAKALLNLGLYKQLGAKIVQDINGQPVLYFLIAGFGIILIMARQWMRFRIQKLASRAASRANTSLRPLLRTIGLTIADAAIWPGLIMFGASRIAAVFSHNVDIVSAAEGLSRLAVALFLVELIHDGCLPRGAAELVGIPANVAAYVRRKIFRFEVLAFPLAALVVILHSENMTLTMRASERICFIAAILLGVRLANQLLRSKSPIIQAIDSSGRFPWMARFQPLIWATVIAIVLSVAVMSFVGFHNTAIQLVIRLESTLWLGIGILLLQLFLAAAVTLHRRRLRFESIRREVDARAAEAESAAAAQPTSIGQNASASESATLSTVAAQIPLQKEEDANSAVERLTGQTQRLISTVSGIAFLFGVYLIWNDVLPALTQFKVYPFGAIDESADVKILTLESLLAGIISVALTVTAARNLPGVLDFSVLERVGLDRSVRYAITTILSYVISLVGIIIAGHLFGFSWDSVQWLAAGLTVGLGFGLQEIFANFISGLIIFFEQPIRVGDIVTVDDVTGVVSRIRIRATTITNWDRKEYIVPNKEFITGRLLNWTLSDTTNRLVLNVGVAYGSDTEKAKTLLVDILEEHPLILDDPAPLVTLEELGNSSVNFTIRCYLPTLDKRLTATHELYTEIHQRFGEAGLEIPFPQTDLHVRDLPAALTMRSEVA